MKHESLMLVRYVGVMVLGWAGLGGSLLTITALCSSALGNLMMSYHQLHKTRHYLLIQ